MIDAPLALAFTTGMVATVNPCGFAMLPAYLSYFLGMEDRSRDRVASILRALEVGLAVSAGFLVVFAGMGVLITKFSVSIEDKLPYVTVVIGIAIIGLGIAMLRGFEPTVTFLPKASKGASSRELSAMFLFGMSYAVSSLSCTIPLFLVAVANTFTKKDFVSGFAVFLAYAAGMALVLMALTMALALARQGVAQRVRKVLPYVHRISGVLLILAGLYLAYYGWYEVQVANGNLDAGGPANVVFSWNQKISQWVTDTGPLRIGLLLAGIIVLGILVTMATRPRDRSHPAND